MKMTLLENAQDSLRHAVEHLVFSDYSNINNLKISLSDTSHAVELLLKEKLQRVHPAFVFKDIDKYPSKNAYTVTTDCAVERLQKIGNVHFGNEDIKTINRCRQIRNQIEHYEFDIDEKEAKFLIGRILSFIFKFTKQELGLDWEQEFKEDDTWKELVSLYDFWKAHASIIEKEMSDSNIPATYCPSCGADTFSLVSDTCMLCGHHEDVMECDYCGELVLESELHCVDLDEYSGVAICDNCFGGDDYSS